MKRLAGMLLSVLVVVAVGAGFVKADITSASILDVVLTDQTPFPAEPGEKVSIEIEIQNDGLMNADNVVLEFSPSEPFSLLNVNDKVKNFNRVSGQGSVKTSYNLYVSKSAVSSQYELEFQLYIAGNRDLVVTKKVSVNVQGEPKLIVESLTTSPSRIEPSSMVKVYATIKNVGTGTAGMAEVSLNSTSAYLTPVLAKGSVYLGDLKPGESKDVLLELSVDSSAEYKTYTTNLEMNYRTENNTQQQVTFYVGVPVTGSVNLDIIKIEPEYRRSLLRFEVANKGTVEAKSIEAKLLVNNQTVGIDYISTLKANKKTTFDFPLVLKGTGTLTMSYIGPGLEKNREVKELVFNYEVPESNGTGTTILVLIVVAVVAYFVWKRKFRKK